MSCTTHTPKKLVIAHRGASGYLPEHSLEAVTMAYAMGADYLEQDLVMTKDNRLVVLHDRYLDNVTNVNEVFPNRKRADGKSYVIDFTLDEIKQLEMTERFKEKEGKKVARFPNRFPLWKSSFKINTFEEEIELIQGLNKSTGKNIGIYPEIKFSAFHYREGRDISKSTLRVLKKYGYTSKEDFIYLQCFNSKELKRIKNSLFKEFEMDLKLVQLLSGDSKYESKWKEDSLKQIAKYADGIGPSMYSIVKKNSKKDSLIITDLVTNAHKAGLVVHPYTFRSDTTKIPEYADSFDDLLDLFLNRVGVDGVFTDFPDKVIKYLEK